jgi:hypothetical protein
MEENLKNNCELIEAFVKEHRRAFTINKIPPYYNKMGIEFIHNDVELALNFLADKPFLKKRGGSYEISDPSWTFEQYLEELEDKKIDKKLKISTINLNELQTDKLKKVLRNYTWNEARNWTAFIVSIIIALVTISRCNTN